ncbi:PP2C family protein-serine/threonine phosphatase [Roseovarius sp.]|jgi:serine/threonine protein phosphatase PrpC
MRPSVDVVYDASMVIEQGRRMRQEDAIVSDFPAGNGFGFVVLADGMGGHAAGDMASKIVVTEVFSELKMQSGDPVDLEGRIGEILCAAARSANDCVGQYSSQSPGSEGMGATLLAPVLMEDRLYWISVGDSPLYLFRDGGLRRLNEIHSVMSQIDYLVDSGIMAREEAVNHPDQQCLTSVLIGREIPQIDCRAVPVQLEHGDILIAASDGLQALGDDRIEELLRFTRQQSAAQIGEGLLRDIARLDDPEQDNVSFCVVKLLKQTEMAKTDDASEMVEAADDLLRETRHGRRGSVTILARVSRAREVAG